jgi:anhydro-N-acetylmuramic acid kinase
MAASRDEVRFRAEYASRVEHLVIGLMSGTSLDGVDAVLTRILTGSGGRVVSVKLLCHFYLPYSGELRALVAALCSSETARIEDLTYAHFGLSEWYAEAVAGLLKKAGQPPEAVDFICLHGQTVWHAPLPRSFPAPEGRLLVKGTLQIGSPAVLRERTGIPVIADLRSRDMAAGGEGAPLAQYIDPFLFGSADEGRIVQNIGGIGNATVLPAGCTPEDVLAFDTGPGNMLIDAVVAAGTGGALKFDPEGSHAAKGRVEEGIVGHLMADPYFSRRPPKSTGREVYGAAFARSFIETSSAAGLSFEDQVATATAFTAESIASAYHDFILPETQVSTVIVAGGGALNATLLRMLASRLQGLRVLSAASMGIPVDAREAMAFALLGHESLMGRPSNLPAVTGARCPVVLGSITL